MDTGFICAAQTVRLAARRLTRRFERALRPVGLSVSQYTILTALVASGGMRQGRLGEVLGFEQTTMTRLVAAMVRRELVTLGPDPKDARSKIVCAGELGLRLYTEGLPLWEKAQQQTLGKVSPEEWEEAKRVLARIGL